MQCPRVGRGSTERRGPSSRKHVCLRFLPAHAHPDPLRLAQNPPSTRARSRRLQPSVASRGTALKGGMETPCVDFESARAHTGWTHAPREASCSLTAESPASLLPGHTREMPPRTGRGPASTGPPAPPARGPHLRRRGKRRPHAPSPWHAVTAARGLGRGHAAGA